MESKPILAVLGILLLVFAWGVISFMSKAAETSKNKKMAESKVAELETEKEKLSSDIARLKTEAGVEENIREKFGLAKEGEGLIVVVDDKNKAVDAEEDSGGFWVFLKNLFR